MSASSSSASSDWMLGEGFTDWALESEEVHLPMRSAPGAPLRRRGGLWLNEDTVGPQSSSD